MGKSRWLLYVGLIGLFLGLAPNVETVAIPEGEQMILRVGVFPWFQYQSSTERWSEEGKDFRREKTGRHVELINPSFLTGIVGLGFLGVYCWKARRSARVT